MKNIINKISLPISEQQIGYIATPKEVVFMDIETTGLSSEHNYIYMIGMAYKDNDNWVLRQLMTEKASDEKELLETFISAIKPFKTLIHYNGNTFDLPFILKRCEANGISFNFDDYAGIDIYKRVASLKHFLRLTSCKQKAIESFLKVARKDEYSGGDLIKVYREYEKAPTAEMERVLLLHNSDDVEGLIAILPILNYCEIFGDDIVVKKVQTNVYNDVNGLSKKELVMTIKLARELPVPVNCNTAGCYFTASGLEAVLKAPLFKEEMKYFYADYKDYYYLPEEDIAIHKSVSEYVDKDFREQALASNCYTRKQSEYLQQWSDEFEPVFKREYASPALFFELTDELKSNRGIFNQYASHVLAMMYNEK